MVIIVLIVFGLVLGSFVGALVWRVHEQAAEAAKKAPNKKYLARLSITRGRSICPHCHHALAAADLVPLFSWTLLRGKCRYCGKPISAEHPLTELAMAAAFVASYIWWPSPLHGAQIAIFVLWLALLPGLTALTVYDLKWQLLPNRIIYPAGVVAAAMAAVNIASAGNPGKALLNELLAVIIGGGIFYVLFQVSKGKWIGGGDVRLGWLLGLIVGTPGKSLLFIFAGAVFGTLVSLPLMATNRLKRTSSIPFGPFLILGAVIAVLFGGHILHWYQYDLLGF